MGHTCKRLGLHTQAVVVSECLFECELHSPFLSPPIMVALVLLASGWGWVLSSLLVAPF
jgi:hypothetical protein